MKKKYIIGNWKMYKDYNEVKDFISFFHKKVAFEKLREEFLEVVICAPYVYLDILCDFLKNDVIKIGAQNVYFEEKGAFTGEISPLMLKSIGVDYVILGHSERRLIFKEDDFLLNKKLKAVLDIGLTPIFCIGESFLANSGNFKKVITESIRNGFKDIFYNDLWKVFLAYEPLFAIGTGKSLTLKEAEEKFGVIEEVFTSLYAKKPFMKMFYGGSVNERNVSFFANSEVISGVLVGGASLDPRTFLRVIENSFSKGYV